MSSGIRVRLKSLAYFVLLTAFVACEGRSSPFGCGGLDEVLGLVVEEPRITVTPATVSTKILPGNSLQVPVVVRFIGGPTRATLNLDGGLPAGVTASFSPSSVTDSMTSIMTIVADSSTAPVIFVYQIVAAETGTSFGVAGRSSMTGEVELPFTLITPGSQIVTVGTTREMTIGVSRKPLFLSAVGLSVLPGTVPSGTTVSFSPPNATGANATLQLGIPMTAATGLYLVRAVGKYGAVRDTATFLLTVQAAPVPPDITIIAAPLTATVPPGESVAYTLAFTRNEGTIGMGSFSQSVAGLPPGATPTFTPGVPTTSSQLLVQTTAATPDGTYPLTVTATLGTLVKTAVVNLVVATPPNFTMTLAPASLTVSRTSSADAVVSLLRTGPANAITIDAQSVPTGVTVTPVPAVVNALGTSSKLAVAVSAVAVPGTYPITIRGVSGSITKTQTLTLTIPAPPPSDVAIAVVTPIATVSSGGTTQIPIRLTRTAAAVGELLELRSTGVPVGGNAWITPAFTTGDTATLNVIAASAGTYNVAVSVARGAFPPTDLAQIIVTPSTAGDFSLLPAPQSLTVPSAMSTGAAVQIGRTNGFAGAVSLVAITDKPADYLVTFSLSSTTGGGMGMTIYVSPNVSLGPHVMKIRGTSGSIVHEVSMTLLVTSPSTPYPYPYSPGIKPPPP